MDCDQAHLRRELRIIQGGGLKVLFKALWVYFILRSGARCGKSCHRLRQRATSLAKGHQVEKVLFRVIKVIFDSSYLLETLQGDSLPRVVNRRCLKRYFLSVWQEA
jgi:hypothetical protein